MFLTKSPYMIKWADTPKNLGMSVYLESGSGGQLSSHMKRYIQNLLKVNMEGPYGLEWPTEEKVKRKEMVAPEARYIFVREALNTSVNECTNWIGDGDPVIGFVHYRFIVEEEVPVAYIYELQLEPHVQQKGLGRVLMQLVELIACKNHLSAVMLTVQKENRLAMNFYTSKLRYMISAISPSKVGPFIGAERSYEILCKVFNEEAKAKLEASRDDQKCLTEEAIAAARNNFSKFSVSTSPETFLLIVVVLLVLVALFSSVPSNHPDAVAAIIASWDKTALHVAVSVGHFSPSVEKLVDLMPVTTLAVKDASGYADLYVANSGNTRPLRY
ncbi:hypothetical protein GIB67_006191 [Kingdonia uniflora]|uniref:N-alpha-acetyltransferase 40 n=1 Tax=Kingdonia uniflora TaxID=39325 RepID=A0A7J7LQ52_9MAGN|nr:hypothetical protein GIB67_006191 [Kingdonia uniflora]